MRRLTMLGICLVVVAFFTAATVLASSPGFVSEDATLTSTTFPDLLVSWHESGLGTSQVTYTVTANGSADYCCLTNSGHCPKAANKENSAGPVSATGTFNVPHNGTVKGSLSVPPPPPPSALSCGTGQTAGVVAVEYTDVVITDNTTPATDSNLSGNTYCLSLAAGVSCPF